MYICRIHLLSLDMYIPKYIRTLGSLFSTIEDRRLYHFAFTSSEQTCTSVSSFHTYTYVHTLKRTLRNLYIRMYVQMTITHTHSSLPNHSPPPPPPSYSPPYRCFVCLKKIMVRTYLFSLIMLSGILQCLLIHYVHGDKEPYYIVPFIGTYVCYTVK